MTEGEIRRIAAAQGDNEPMREIALHLLDALADYPDEEARVAREADCMAEGEDRVEAIKRRGARVARDAAAVEQGVRGARLLGERLTDVEDEGEAVLLLALLERLCQWDVGFPSTLEHHFACDEFAACAARYAELWRIARTRS